MALLNIISEDSCCGRRLSKALQKEKVRGDTWECPSCGVEWRAELKEQDGTPYRLWTPRCPFTVLHLG